METPNSTSQTVKNFFFPKNFKSELAPKKLSRDHTFMKYNAEIYEWGLNWGVIELLIYWFRRVLGSCL